ncbi:TonB-dependent receptor [Niabella ginsengisoli]|uniref:TonB-dependent receptor n=1 Tax=Niabella ginsengisoli TaxID=522298 RepID=A0ABS9SNF9_9BACT|nr:TonB-dependent receptor [Niabella ginsengisoli]MCH5599811.1 TonB-dependent receptor [Niabella ginsengisoli]
MRKYIQLTVFLLLAFLFQSYGQNASITGYVIDSSINQPLTNASVVLLQAKDSFIVKDTRAAKDGRFSFSNLSDSSNYILFFSYPKYVDYSHKTEIKDWAKGTVDMGNISLIQREKFLEEVIVKSRVAAIKIKGDTTEYLADSFRVQPNASVEDLLKQLPGLQVDQFGNITAQGQKVKKVLVDGEEFFSDDPTLVTRNLRADMIDKVQVYDKKSDAAAFTGIEDGVRDKTINLKIKEDKNNGIFGKAEAGAGTDERYNAQGIVNFFKGKRRMSAYATTSNIGRIGLGSADKEKIGDTDDGRENYNGKGLPTATSAGVHYDKKWNADKQSINGNYKFNTMDVEGNETTISQNNLPTGLILSNSVSNFNNTNTSHRANAKYMHKFDTTSTVTVYTDGSFNSNKNANISNAVNLRGDSSLLYDNNNNSFSNYDLNSYNVNVNWEKKFKKYGRTISFYLNNNFSNDASSGESRYESRFYDTENNLDSTASLNLRKTMNDDWRTTNLNVNYTEPLSTKLSLIINYTLHNESANDDKRSFNLTSASPNIVDTAFSTKMSTSILSNQAGASLNYTAKK